MTTKSRRVEIRGMPVDIVRKDIKNLHLGVYPPAGRVRVAVPRRLTDDAVRLAVISRLGWIRRRQAEFEAQARQSRREFVTGESHFVEGRRYRLNRIERDGPPAIVLRGHRTMDVFVRPGTLPEDVEVIFQSWYRSRIRMQIPTLIEKWSPKVGITVADVRIRRMKTRWGSCNAAARRI